MAKEEGRTPELRKHPAEGLAVGGELGEDGFLRVESVFGLLENDIGVAFEHSLGDFFATIGG